ncbi:MAG: hypothetical protein HY875_15210 [Chloroflexi bacterium]|nr:hypothetical protein [Chloroflexota bacterium]
MGEKATAETAGASGGAVVGTGAHVPGLATPSGPGPLGSFFDAPPSAVSETLAPQTSGAVSGVREAATGAAETTRSRMPE